MRTRTQLARYLAVVLMVVVASSAQAAITLPSLFADHMVLQRNKLIPVWGWAEPGEQVVVKMEGQEGIATADADGRWKVCIGPMVAGGPYTMTLTAKSGTVTIADVAVGEVWICSGQSNMQWDVQNSMDFDKEKHVASYPNLRMFTVERVSMETPQTKCNGAWAVCSTETVGAFSAVGYFFARKLHQDLGVPVGMINTSWGGTPAESWTTMESLKANPLYADLLQRWDEKMANYPTAKAQYDQDLAAWEAEKKVAEDQKTEFTKPRPGAPMDPAHPWRPAGLFNGMIAPLAPYAIQGAIWYQGESNADRAYQYRELFPRMIQDWRAAWGQGDFSFYFVQLANFMERKPEPGDSGWAELREAQTRTLSLPNTGMAVTIDIGDAKDIHPRNKQEVGKRLALIALNRDYGKDVNRSGPIYATMARTSLGKKVILRFTENTLGMATRGKNKPTGFSIAGADRKFVWARVKVRRHKVTVWHPDIKDPVAVRYAWADNPDCNLIDRAGLPASPFRTDDWPGITVNNR